MLDDNLDINIKNESVELDDLLKPERPKLKKIKRPKVRVPSAASETPEKVMPKEILKTQTEAGLDDFVEKNPSTENDIESSSTDLVRAVDVETNVAAETKSYILQDLPPDLGYSSDEMEQYEGLNENYVKKTTLYVVSAVFLIVGLFIGKSLFKATMVEKRGLDEIVLNSDVPAGRPRCGLTEASQACVLYIMNCYKQELNGSDFYAIAATLTGREQYMIKSENLRYDTVKIRPGYFAQINIPAIR